MFSFEHLDLSELYETVHYSEGSHQKQTQSRCSMVSNGGEALPWEKGTKEGLLLSRYHQEKEIQPFTNSDPPFPSCSEHKEKLFDAEPAKERQNAGYLEILRNYRSRVRRINREKIKIHGLNKKGNEVVAKEKLSTTAILRLAGEKFIHLANPWSKKESSTVSRSYATSFVGLSEEENKDAELVLHLLFAADKIDKREFREAKQILRKCKKLSFDNGNPIQRLGYHFSRALRERIDRATGRCRSSEVCRVLQNYTENELSRINSTLFAFQKAAPFYYASQFAGVQVIIEQVEGAKKIHIIDLQIRLGMQYTMLIQALAARGSECPVELLKITAVATNSNEVVEATGRRLKSFSESFYLPFSFRVITVEDMLDLHENLFELDDEEAVAVYSEFTMMSMIAKPERLNSLMEVIRAINPCVMVVTEVEANHNSPVFVNRFTEALFYFGAFFDAFEDCLNDKGAERIVTETIFGQGMKNILVAEEEERTIRHVRIDVWRAFFTQYGMFEIEFSMASKYQANLLLKKFPRGSSCTIEMDGKCMIFGWKGTPIKSLSAWIFD